MPSIPVKIVTGRSLDQGRAKGHGKFSEKYLENVAICEFDPQDLETLGIVEGDNVRVETEMGSVVLKAVLSSQIPHKGIVFIPYGPWINLIITDVETKGTGLPTMKGLNANVIPALKDDVQILREEKIVTETVIPNVVCTFCGCCCDDIIATVRDGRIIGLKNTCALSREKFMNYNHERLLTPMIRKNGGQRVADVHEAVERAASILAQADYPLLYGWSSTSCEAISIGLELAEALGGVIDNTSSVCHGPMIIGLHDIGESTCTLGDVKHRADLVVYWGCNPVHAHPRHIPRFFLSGGMFRKSFRERKLIVVDVRKTDTSKTPGLEDYIQVTPSGDFELLCALRAAVRFDEIEQDEVSGVPVETIERIAEEMVSCEFGVIFFGLGLTMTAGKDRNIDAALSLVKDLNSKTKFVIMPMRGHGNVAGANQVTTWQTGYPFAVDFSQGFPRYNPGETSTVDILARGDCDTALIVASDPVSNFPVTASKHLMEIPLITLDPHLTPTTQVSDVVFPAAHVGIETKGTVYRMDGVPLVAKKIVDPPLGIRSDVEVLRMILKEVRALGL